MKRIKNMIDAKALVKFILILELSLTCPLFVPLVDELTDEET